MFMFLDQRKQAKMQWLQDPNQSNVDNLNSINGVLKSVKKKFILEEIF